MSYEDTNCPCGDRKERETMLCAACMADMIDHPSMRVFQSAAPVEDRKYAATVLLTLARGRKRRELFNAGTEARVPPSPPVTVGRPNGGGE